jgi:hypothetical protein
MLMLEILAQIASFSLILTNVSGFPCQAFLSAKPDQTFVLKIR